MLIAAARMVLALSAFLRKKFSRAMARKMPQKIYSPVPKSTFHRPSRAYLKPRSVERSMVFATPVEPLMTRPGAFRGIRLPKMNRNSS